MHIKGDPTWDSQDETKTTENSIFNNSRNNTDINIYVSATRWKYYSQTLVPTW